MSVTANRKVVITYDGAVEGVQQLTDVENTSSPGEIDYVSLSPGANTITKPTGALACTIVPPVGNSTEVTLKGISGDTGIILHPTGPASISLASTVTSFVLTAASTVTGCRLFWS